MVLPVFDEIAPPPAEPPAAPLHAMISRYQLAAAP